MHPLLERQELLHREATKLLEEVILPILKNFGEVVVGGSYAYKLLNHPDIDLDVVNPNVTKEIYGELCARLISLASTKDFETCDRVAFPHTHPGDRPTGYWIAPNIYFGNSLWKLDIWFQKPEWYTGDTNKYQQKLLGLDDEKRITILSLKEELKSEGVYGVGKEFLSVDVYDGVLDIGVKTVAELRECLKRGV